jgi:hypothetical protein
MREAHESFLKTLGTSREDARKLEVSVAMPFSDGSEVRLKYDETSI